MSNENALTDEEIIERLRTNDSSIIDSISAICLDKFTEENTRAKSIDSKGGALLGASGLSSSLVFTFGGLLIEKIKNVSLPIFGCPIPWLVVFYLLSSTLFLGSAIFSVLAIAARSDWKTFSDNDIFNKEMIHGPDGVNAYKRYLISHIWLVYNNNYKINENKGGKLRWGHWLFVSGLVPLLVIVIIISLYILQKGGLNNG